MSRENYTLHVFIWSEGEVGFTAWLAKYAFKQVAVLSYLKVSNVCYPMNAWRIIPPAVNMTALLECY